MSEVLTAIIHLGFGSLGATRIEACHALWNKASERILCKAGLRLIRHVPKGFKKNGEWVEENLLSITRMEWEEHASNNATHSDGNVAAIHSRR